MKIIDNLLNRKHKKELELIQARQDLIQKQLDLFDRTERLRAKNRIQKPELSATEHEMLEAYGKGIHVYSCINAIAEKAASIQPEKQNQEGEVQSDDEVMDLLLNPNPDDTHYDLMELTQIWMESVGNAYWHKIENENANYNYKEILKPIRPTRMAIIPDSNAQSVLGYAFNVKGFQRNFDKMKINGIDKISPDEFRDKVIELKGLKVKKNGKLGFKNLNDWIPLEPEEIIHFRYRHPYNDWYGMSPLQPLLLSWETELYARAWNRNFFKNGAIPLGIITLPSDRPIDPEELKALQEKWEKNHGGTSNSHKTAWLTEGAGYETLESTHKDLEFLNLLRLTREETMEVFNVPPTVLHIYEGIHSSTQSIGIREQRKIFWEDCIKPKLTKIYNTLSLHFYPNRDFKIVPNYSNISILQQDWQEIAKPATELYLAGLTTREETRTHILNLPEKADGEFVAPAITLDRIKKKTEDRTELWQKAMKQIEPMENRLFDWLKNSLFAEQEKRILREFDLAWNKDANDTLMIFDLDIEIDTFTDESYSIYTELLNEQAETVFQQLGIEMTFEISDYRVQEALRKLSFTFADHVNRTTKEKLRATLSEGIARGDDREEMRIRVQEVFGDTVRGTAQRADMIARTEIISVTNAGNLEAYRQAKTVRGKEWLSSKDNRVRDTHTDLDGQQRPIDRNFLSSSGAKLAYPGDPDAPAAERINCRCTMLAIMK